jgi:hypothetical protein
MGRRTEEIDRMGAFGIWSMMAEGRGRVARARSAALVGLALASVAVFVRAAPAAAACPNEPARTGPSANLPDCRAYEQVTPANKQSAVLNLENATMSAVAAEDGEALALEAKAAFGPDPQESGSLSVFSRTSSGWKIASVKPTGSGDTVYTPEILSPNLTQVGAQAYTEVPSTPDWGYQVGVPGDPLTTVAETPGEEHKRHGGDRLLGASPDFSHIIFGSTDHTLASVEPTGTDEDAYDLYEWVDGGQLRLVNVTGEGAQAKVIGKCGATLGFGYPTGGFGSRSLAGVSAKNAVSADGSKVFFTAPDPDGEGEGCFVYSPTGRAPNAPRLYMRVTEMIGGHEQSRTVELSYPQGVTLSSEEEEIEVIYQAASVDGAKVFFSTERALTPNAEKSELGKTINHLYEYDTQAEAGERLRLIFQGAEEEGSQRRGTVFPSEDGSVVYFYRNNTSTLYRYEAGAGPPQKIASVLHPQGGEAPYSTPNGEFFVFWSEGVGGELRGMGHRSELYRYDHLDGSVMCVSCGPGNPPEEGHAYASGDLMGRLGFINLTPEIIQMSENGSEVFFDSTAALVPQAVNAREPVVGVESEEVTDVYEWEADGAGSCTMGVGCTYLISQGNNPNDSALIGASRDGSNVFFLTDAQLVPQDTDTSGDIYDARVGGGFPAPVESIGCLGDTCVSVPPALNDPTPASSSFSGPGDLVSSLPSAVPEVAPKAKRCGKGKVRRHGRCAKRPSRARKTTRQATRHSRGGSK